jgi:23S rRNA G2445 N2-methylase RlmL
VPATVIARSVHGLEWVAADEVAARLGAAGRPVLARREVVFDLPRLEPAVLGLRTVDDAFLLVGRLDGIGTTKDTVAPFARRLAGLPWSDRLAALHALRPVPEGPRFDVVASLSGPRSYNRFAVENAAGAALAPVLGGRHLARTTEGRPPGEPDLTVRVFVRDATATVALRLGDRPLHRRDYKQDTGPGTLHPPVAAALARLVGLADGCVGRDPFCGDGTIPIEAALAYPGARILASDLDPDRVAAARRNAARAGVTIEASVADAVGPAAVSHSVDAVLTNPPWNLAVDARGGLAGSIEPFWRRLPEILAADGRLCAITDADLDVPGTLRRMGYGVGLATRVRLAGRVSDVILAGRAAPALPSGLAAWRRLALAAGVSLDV